MRRQIGRLPFVRRVLNLRYGGPLRSGPKKGELRAVVYLPTWLRWDVMRQRPHYVLQEFADRGHPVFFVDPRETSTRCLNGVTIVPGVRHTPYRNTLLYVHYAPAAEPASLYVDSAIVYDITDDLTAFAENEGQKPPEAVVRHHRRLIDDADIVSAAGPGLATKYRKERADLVYAPNGVDISIFATRAPRPVDMPPPLPESPIAGYHGALAEWRFDFELFMSTANALPQWRFVLIGPVDPRVSARVGQLGELPNVLLLGEKPAAELGGYVQAFDVGTMWYPLNEVTSKALPMKMNEYLAAGVPAVGTPLPACKGVPGVWTADSPSSYADALNQALESARSKDWPQSISAQVEESEWPNALRPLFDALDRDELLASV